MWKYEGYLEVVGGGLAVCCWDVLKLFLPLIRFAVGLPVRGLRVATGSGGLGVLQPFKGSWGQRRGILCLVLGLFNSS